MAILPILSILLTAVIIIVSVLLVLIVLVQRPKQEGLGAAFGGGAFDSTLGAHTTDVLQKITTYMAIAFFVSAIGLSMVKTRESDAASVPGVLEGLEQTEAQQQPAMPPEIQKIIDDAAAAGNPVAADSAESTPASETEVTPAESDTPDAAETEGE